MSRGGGMHLKRGSVSVVLSEIQLLRSWRQTALLQKIGFWRIVTLSSDCREKAHPLVKCGNDNPWPKGKAKFKHIIMHNLFSQLYHVNLFYMISGVKLSTFQVSLARGEKLRSPPNISGNMSFEPSPYLERLPRTSSIDPECT